MTKMTKMTNINAEKHKPWGLTVPGRPPTPSEGAAYQYSRVGPRQSQRLFSFENGTCLEYGPDDLVDEFEISHPFANQVAIIDKAIRDIKAVRDRYQRPARNSLMGHRESGIESEEDPFDNFRTQQLDPSLVSSYSIESGTYKQVPSRFATVGNLISVHSYPNKSNLLLDEHRGHSADTRYGTTGKPPFGTIPRRLQNRDGQKSDGQHHQHVPGQQKSQNAYTGGQAPADRSRGRARRGNRSTSSMGPTEQKPQQIDGFSPASQHGSAGSDRQEREHMNGFDRGSQHSSMELARESSVENMHQHIQMHAGQSSGQQFQQVNYDDPLFRQQFLQVTGATSTENLVLSAQAQGQNVQVQGFQKMYLQQQHDEEEATSREVLPLTQQYEQEEALMRELNDARQDAMNISTGNYDYVRFIDDQNNESRERGEQILRGDAINGQAVMQSRPTSSGADSLGHQNELMMGSFGEGPRRPGMLRTPLASHQSEQGNISSPSLSYYSGSRSPVSRASADNSADQLLVGLRRSRSDTAFRNPNEGHLQDQAYPSHRSALTSPQIYNPNGRTFQSTVDDSHRMGSRITLPWGFGGQRPGSATSSNNSSENRIFGEVSGSMSRKPSPAGDFRHVRNLGGRRLGLYESRASSAGLLNTDDESDAPETEIGGTRSRRGAKGHSRQRSASAGNMR